MTVNNVCLLAVGDCVLSALTGTYVLQRNESDGIHLNANDVSYDYNFLSTASETAENKIIYTTNAVWNGADADSTSVPPDKKAETLIHRSLSLLFSAIMPQYTCSTLSISA